MGKTLVIAEKPSVATDIAKTLGGLKRSPIIMKATNTSSPLQSVIYWRIKAPEEYEVKRGKWSFAHLPVIPPHFELQPIKKSEAKLKNTLQIN